MDKVRLLILPVLLAFLTPGCNQPAAYETEIQEIDSLRLRLTGFRVLLDSLDTEETARLAVHVDTQYNYLLQNYPNQNDREFWLHEVPQFADIRKMLTSLGKKKKGIRQSIEYSDKQLLTLKNSIEDEKLTAEEIKKYLDREYQAYLSLSFTFNKYVEGAKRALKLWEINQEPYDSIVNQLRAEQQ